MHPGCSSVHSGCNPTWPGVQHARAVVLPRLPRRGVQSAAAPTGARVRVPRRGGDGGCARAPVGAGGASVRDAQRTRTRTLPLTLPLTLTLTRTLTLTVTLTLTLTLTLTPTLTRALTLTLTLTLTLPLTLTLTPTLTP